jgi:hypothetical protein
VTACLKTTTTIPISKSKVKKIKLKNSKHYKGEILLGTIWYLENTGTLYTLCRISLTDEEDPEDGILLLMKCQCL